MMARRARESGSCEANIVHPSIHPSIASAVATEMRLRPLWVQELLQIEATSSNLPILLSIHHRTVCTHACMLRCISLVLQYRYM